MAAARAKNECTPNGHAEIMRGNFDNLDDEAYADADIEAVANELEASKSHRNRKHTLATFGCCWTL